MPPRYSVFVSDHPDAPAHLGQEGPAPEAVEASYTFAGDARGLLPLCALVQRVFHEQPSLTAYRVFRGAGLGMLFSSGDWEHLPRLVGNPGKSKKS